MRAIQALIMALSFNALVADADDGPRPPILISGTPAQQMQALKKQYADASAAVEKARLHARVSINARNEEPAMPNPSAYCDAMLKIAKDHPSNPERCLGLTWVTDAGSEEQTAEAVRILIRDHLTDPNIGELCKLTFYFSIIARCVPTEALRKIVTENPAAGTRVLAKYVLAKQLLEKADKGRIAREPDFGGRGRYANCYFDPADADALKKVDSEALENDACQMLNQIVSDRNASATPLSFAHVEGMPKTAGQWAARTLFEFHHLKKGKPVPEIVGEDIQGRPMRLSDFRGKVVILQFGETWDGFDDGQLLNRVISDMYLDRGVEFVGVYQGGDRDRFKGMIEKDKIKWRSFWDGGKDGGKIHRQWHALPENLAGIHGFIIDHRGSFCAPLSADEHQARTIAEAVRAAKVDKRPKTDSVKP